ncbi:MAG TPA: cellulase family glycosylhydrolase [Rectinemataceae bacterium]
MVVRGDRFVDEWGRSLVLRGLNLGGDSKFPVRPDGRTHVSEGFYEATDVSFVGRPFPLDEAEEHFARLAGWGMRFHRLLVTWEAIEHAGPGIYDEAYLDYIEALVEIAARKGISLFIDPHQDVWSRWTGGDGAPMWTLEAAGFEPRNLHASGAALLHQEAGSSYPRMEWFSNHLRLACATMFSLFFAGNDLAPGITVEGVPIQDWLQERYFSAMGKLSARLAGKPNVVGFDSMNEPGDGFIGVEDIRMRRPDLLVPGLAPSPLEAMAAGEGWKTEAPRIGIRGLGLAPKGREALGSAGIRAWKPGETCVWRRLGLWELGSEGPRALRPGWFSERLNSGRGAGAAPREAFAQFYLKPFFWRFAQRVRGAAPGAGRFALFIEGPPSGARPAWAPGEAMPEPVVNSTHWYDAFTLSFKRWTGFLAYDQEEEKAILGPRAVRAYFARAMKRIVLHSASSMGACPSLLGEFGLPFDLNSRLAYRRHNAPGRYRIHEKALAAYYDALDSALLDGTLWNYAASNESQWGDGWNGEDLSVFSSEEGGRALAGFVRPYATAVAGRIQSMSFSMKTGDFRLSWEPDHRIEAPTEVFVPRLQYPRGYRVEAESCIHARAFGNETDTSGSLEESGYDTLELKALPGAIACSIVLRRI